MGGFLKTCEVCDVLGEPPHRLAELIRSRKIPKPVKDVSGDYQWAPEDVERARQALAQRRKPSQPREVPA